jgi:small subunit ribosomal protein S6
MPHYEHVLIARPDVSPQQIDALVEDMTRLVETGGGKITRQEYWGLRNLAYPIRKARKGHYTLLNLEAPAPAVHELERRLRINEDVMRFLTVRIDEEAAAEVAAKEAKRAARGA